MDSAMTKTMSRWNKFRDLVPLFASKCFILGGNSRLYSAYVNCVMLHRDKTWPVKEKEVIRLESNGTKIVKWMCNIKPGDIISGEELMT